MPPPAPATEGTPVMDAHGMAPDAVFALLKTLGGEIGTVWVLGCEPAVVDDRMGLSAPVAGAVDGRGAARRRAGRGGRRRRAVGCSTRTGRGGEEVDSGVSRS